MPLDKQILVVLLRYGNLDQDTEPLLSAAEVFRRTGVKSGTQWHIVDRWRRNNFKVVVRTCLRGHKPMLSEQQQLLLTAPNLLLTQSHLSLEERACKP